MAKILVSITHGKDDVDRATVGFVVANASAAAGCESVVFLSVDGVRLAQRAYADGAQAAGFSPLADLIASFTQAGGTIWVCPPCMKAREIPETDLIGGTILAGGAKVVEFLATGGQSISY